jgi:predicted transcriptional regulator
MNFTSENILIETFLAKPKAFFRNVTGKELKRYYVLREFDSGYGVADIVIGSFAPYLSVKNLRSCVDVNWAGALVNSQNNNIFSAKDFAKIYGVSMSTARNKLNQFVSAGFMKKNNQANYSVDKEYKVAVGTSIALEAKLQKWKQALNQARRYQKYADYSFVLLDKRFSAPAEDNIEEFSKHNVGLVTMSGHTASIHYLPKSSGAPRNMYFYKFNEAVYQYFKSTYGCSEEFCSK